MILKPKFPKGWGIVVQSDKKQEKAKTFEEILEQTHSEYPLQHFANIQVWTDRNIEYHKHADRELGRKNGQLTPLEQILKNGAGNCEDGTVIISIAAKHFGYKTGGMSIVPADHSEPGHMVCVYKDPETGLYGSAGITIADFLPPLTETLEELAEGIAFSNHWTRAKATRIKYDVNALRFGRQKIKYRRTKPRNINLKQKYNLEVGKLETKEGTLDVEMDGNAYKITFDGLIAPPESTGLSGVITDISFTKLPERYSNPYNVDIHTEINEWLRNNVDIYFKVENNRPSVTSVFVSNHDSRIVADCKQTVLSREELIKKKQLRHYTKLVKAASQILCEPAVRARWKRNRRILREKQRLLEYAKTGKGIKILKPKKGNGVRYKEVD